MVSLNYEVRHTKRNIIRFLKKHRALLVMAAVAVVAAIVVVLAVVPNVVGEKRNEEQDLESLVGDDGEDGQHEQPEPRAAKLGMTLLNTVGGGKALITNMEKLAAEDMAAGTLESFEVREAQGSQNQQIQDVYTMINNGVSTIIVADADAYNFGKIAEICRSNGIGVIACNIEADSGFAVNVRDTSDASADFAQFMKDNGVESTDILRGTAGQAQTVGGIVGVNHQYEELWDAAYAISESIGAGAPIESMIVFDYNANDILRTWLKQDTVPTAVAGVGTVAYIKTWYELTHGGVEIVVAEAEEEGGEDEVITVSAGADEFKGCAMTSPGNMAEVLYRFASGVMQGKSLPSENYIYEVAGYDIITNDTVEEYYNKSRNLDSGLVYSDIPMEDIDALFS